MTSTSSKLSGHDFYSSIGSPKYVVAPMVDQSELAWRILSRLHGATLAYTPMFHAQLFSNSLQPKYFQESFDTSSSSLEGIAPYDRPLIVQFCANDKELWLKAAEKVVGRCDAVDLNLGCPQGIAKKGHYGAFLMDEWELVGSMISHLHANLALPVIAKIRVFPSLEKTLSYASHILTSGAQLLTVHGRIREAKGQLAGLADWTKIQAVTNLLGTQIPILANGGLPSGEEIEDCLKETGANGVMSAEGNLYNPMIFSPLNAKGGRDYKEILPPLMKSALNECDNELIGNWDRDLAAYAPATYLASQYLAIVETLPSTETSSSAIKSHLFKLFRPIWATGRHVDLRESLASSGGGGGGGSNSTRKEKLNQVRLIVEEFKKRIKADLEEGLLPPNSSRPLTHEEVLKDFGGVIPYSHAQPYLRVATPPSEPIPLIGKRPHSPDLIASTSLAATDLPSISTSSESKKLKLETNPTADTKEKIHLVCINHSSIPRCTNAPSVKCVHGACLACCIILSKPSTSSTLSITEEVTTTTTSTVGEALECPFHLDKLRKEFEKNQTKKTHAKEKKRLHKERNDLMQIEAEKNKLRKKEEKRLGHELRLGRNVAANAAADVVEEGEGVEKAEEVKEVVALEGNELVIEAVEKEEEEKEKKEV